MLYLAGGWVEGSNSWSEESPPNRLFRVFLATRYNMHGHDTLSNIVSQFPTPRSKDEYLLHG